MQQNISKWNVLFILGEALCQQFTHISFNFQHISVKTTPSPILQIWNN